MGKLRAVLNGPRSSSRVSGRRRWPVLLCCALVPVWSHDAEATPSFPGVVESYYGLSADPVDPPNGCQLCHIDDIGGTPMTLRPFGRLLYTQLGVVPYDDQSLRSALMQLDTQYPDLAAAIKSGADPNNAPATPSSSAIDGGGAATAVNAVPADPIPEYGCTIGHTTNARTVLWPIGALLAVMAFRHRRRKSETLAVERPFPSIRDPSIRR